MRNGGNGNPERDSDLFDYPLIGDYVGFVLRSAKRHKVRFALAFLAVFLAALVMLALLPRQYQVQATLLAQRNPIMGTLSNPTVNREGDMPARAAREVVMRRENLIELLKQTDFIQRHLATRAPIANVRDWMVEKITGKRPTREEQLESFADALATKLWVVVGPEGTVTIAFVWSSPDLAYQLVEAAVQSYLEARHAAEINVIGETIAILEARDATLRKEALTLSAQLSEKEKALRRSAPRAPASQPAARSRAALAADEETARLESTLASRQRALADLDEFRRRRVDELQAQLAQQTNVYAPQHPTVIGTRKAIESLSGPSPQMEQLRTEIAELETEVKRRGGYVPSSPTAAPPMAAYAIADLARLDDLDPALEYERNQLKSVLRQHANLLERIDAARVEMQTAQAAFKYRYSVISPPQYPKGPLRPYVLLFVGGGILGGLAVAFLATTLADLRTGRVIERWQVERQLKLPVLSEPHH